MATKATKERQLFFVVTRKSIRDSIRKQVGNKRLRQIWHRYQSEHSGEPKTKIVITPAKGAKGNANQPSSGKRQA